MAGLLKKGFVVQDECEIYSLGETIIVIEGVIYCRGGVQIKVLKKVKTVSGSGPARVVRRDKYTYHAMLASKAGIMRYDSPCGHRPNHHKHTFDPLNKPNDLDGVITEYTNEDDTPTLAGMIEEVAQWYWDNHEALAANGLVDEAFSA